MGLRISFVESIEHKHNQCSMFDYFCSEDTSQHMFLSAKLAESLQKLFVALSTRKLFLILNR